MKKINVRFMAMSALFAALLCIFGPNSVPIGPIPISLTNFVLYFAIYIIETKGLTTSYVVYLLLGLVGLPVFSGYSGGAAKLFGPTGGYLIGFIPMIIIMGLAFYLPKASLMIRIAAAVIGMIIGTIVAYAFGTVWFVHQAHYTYTEALAVCVYPFIPFDLAKIIIATIIAMPVRFALLKAGLIGADRTIKA